MEDQMPKDKRYPNNDQTWGIVLTCLALIVMALLVVKAPLRTSGFEAAITTSEEQLPAPD